jgi:hypothetical protein
MMTARQKKIEELKKDIAFTKECIKKFNEEREREIKEIENGERGLITTWTHEDINEAKFSLNQDEKELSMLLKQEGI